jgi:hypothetical protein
MKRRITAALAAIGLVAAMSGFGAVSAMADEPVDDTTTVVEETTTPPEESTTEDESTEESTETPEESTEESTAESTEEATDESTTEEESTEEESTEEESTEEDSTEEDSTEEGSTEGDPNALADDETDVPVVEGYTPEQVKEAQAFVEANGLGQNARFFGVEICHANWWGWGWDTWTVNILEYALHYLFDSDDIMPGILGLFPKNLDTDFDGVTGQQIFDNGCSKKVKVYDPPEWGGDEYCWDGEAQDGYIWVYYSEQMEGKAYWLISDGDGFSYEVPYSYEWSQVYVPAGSYSVELVPIGGWYIKHGGPYWIDIAAAENCGCIVNQDRVEKASLTLDLVALPTPCAEAEVSVTPPTCEAASTLVLGATFLAEFGDPEYEGAHYTVTATADEGYRFSPGEGVPPDGLEKVFEGDLAAKLTNCGGLAMTGSSGDIGAPLWLAGIALIGGVGALVFSRRRDSEVTETE